MLGGELWLHGTLQQRLQGWLWWQRLSWRSPQLPGCAVLQVGTPLCVPSQGGMDLGRIASLELNHKPVDSARVRSLMLLLLPVSCQLVMCQRPGAVLPECPPSAAVLSQVVTAAVVSAGG